MPFESETRSVVYDVKLDLIQPRDWNEADARGFSVLCLRKDAAEQRVRDSSQVPLSNSISSSLSTRHSKGIVIDAVCCTSMLSPDRSTSPGRPNNVSVLQTPTVLNYTKLCSSPCALQRLSFYSPAASVSPSTSGVVPV